MARGWESKAIEAQQEQSEGEKGRQNAPAMTAEEIQRRSRRATLELARARVFADLQRARTPAHRAMLQDALASLDHQLTTDD
jgi:hypothetical protein